eukprot:XP_014003473.1 PREDICTED: uncharacterized protein LOC106573198 isoform X2 [Salmo salar]
MSSTCDSLIDDIEDMVSADDPTPQERQYARKSIIPRARKRNTQQTTEVLHADSVIPGMQKIWMRTWGCSHNNSDGEYMAGQLAASGYKMTAPNLYPTQIFAPEKSEEATAPEVLGARSTGSIGAPQRLTAQEVSGTHRGSQHRKYRGPTEAHSTGSIRDPQRLTAQEVSGTHRGSQHRKYRGPTEAHSTGSIGDPQRPQHQKY